MARTQGEWEEKLGTYITTKYNSGKNILINGINKYLNFNSLSGESGYGIRDNGGTIEVKNNGGSWGAIGGGGAGSGDVVGPASADDNALARFDGTTGKLIQNSRIKVSDNGEMVLEDTTATVQPRIHLKSRSEWTYPSHEGDLVRLQWMNEYYKAAIAFLDNAGNDKVAIVGHDFLASYSAALDKTFTNTNINTTTDVITLTSHGWSTGDAVWLNVSTYKLADMPDGVFPFFRYYIRAVDANTIALYRSSSDATGDTNRLPLDNAHGTATYTITKNNWHHHISTEVSDKSGVLGSDGQLHTRTAYNYDVYPAVLRHIDAEVHVVDQALKMLSSSNSELQFGVSPERAGRRFSLQRHAASDELRIVYYTGTGMSASAAMQFALSNGFVGVGTSPDASTYRVKVGGSLLATNKIVANGDIEANTTGTGAINVMARSNVASTNRGGAFRATGESNGATTYRGAFFAYDPLNNKAVIGTHDAADENSANDIEAIKIDRTTGAVEVATSLTSTVDTTTPTVKASSSAGVLVKANNGTDVAILGAGNTANATFYGGMNIDGATRLATSLTGVLRADSGVVSVDGDVTDLVTKSTSSDINTGTATGNVITPDALAGSYAGTKTIAVQINGSASGSTALATGDGQASIPIDTALNGMNIVAVKAYCTTVSSSGAVTINIRRSRRSSATARTIVDTLSTAITIDVSEFESADATAPVINTSNDDLATGDMLLVDIDAAGTGVLGLTILITCQLP